MKLHFSYPPYAGDCKTWMGVSNELKTIITLARNMYYPGYTQTSKKSMPTVFTIL